MNYSSFILVLRSGPVESNLRVESKSCALHDVELRLRIPSIQLDMLTAGRLDQGSSGDTGGDQTQQQRADHDWREEREESVVITCSPLGSTSRY